MLNKRPAKIAFLGTGLMGAPMASNLLTAGHEVTVWNRSVDKTEALVSNGALAAKTVTDAAASAEVVIVMLSSGPVCEDILFGESRVAEAMSENAILVVMSSVGFDEARAMAQKARALGLRWLDAPVSGGTAGALSGQLSIMVGGKEETFDAVKSVLEAMGNPLRIGNDGAGALAKLINQMMVASTIVNVAEAMLLAERAGADPERVREAMMGGFAASRILDLHGQRMINRNFVAGGPARYQLKDTRAALAVADDLNLDLPGLKLANQLFADLVEHGHCDLDHSALLLELERRNPDG